MSRTGRWVFDTNALVSRLLVPGSVPSKALQKGLESGYLLVSDETLDELAEVLERPKFDKYVGAGERRRFFELLGRVAIRVEILRPIQAAGIPRTTNSLQWRWEGWRMRWSAEIGICSNYTPFWVFRS